MYELINKRHLLRCSLCNCLSEASVQLKADKSCAELWHTHRIIRGEIEQEILGPDNLGLSWLCNNTKMSIEWVSGSNSGRVPSNAVPGGVDRGNRLYVARASHAGSLVPGKLHSAYKCAYVRWTLKSLVSRLLGAHVLSYGGREHTKGSGYEVLTGDGFQWKTAEGGRVPQGAVQVRGSLFLYYERILQRLEWNNWLSILVWFQVLKQSSRD